MAEFILYIATSLDGYIARLDGSIDWLPSPEEDGDDNSYTKFYNSIDALVMGAKTYQQVLTFGDWPYPDKVSYILTSQDFRTDRTDICFVKGGVEEVVENVHKNGYQRVWLVGGGKIASTFINRDLVDEYIITVIPTILGEGISLFQSVPELKLDLISAQIYSSSLVELHYQKK
jgi:dihydrofolate reductase